MEGWIKLHRKFLLWEWFDDNNMLKLFLYLLLKANHEDKQWKGILIKRGQLITGLNSLSNETKLSIKSIRTCLKKLETTGEIGKQSGNQYSVITIYNYDSYQVSDKDNGNPKGKQEANKGQTKGSKQELKNDKNEKNKYMDVVYFPKSPQIDEAFKDYLKLRSTHKLIMTDRAIKSLVKKLRELSGGEVKKALDMIDNAIVGKWKTFYPNKD